MTYSDPVTTSTRPRLVILKGPPGHAAVTLEQTQLDALRHAFDVIEVHSPEAARKMLDGATGGILICATCEHLNIDAPAPAAILERIGDGIGLVDSHSALRWTDARFKVHDEHVRSEFISFCRKALEQFNRPVEPAHPDQARRHAKRFSFASDGAHYELIICPASLDQTQDRVTSVVGVMYDITASIRQRELAHQIDLAGVDLSRFDPALIGKMNMAERLKVLEQKIIKAMHEVLHFDNFEVRLLDRETGQLELVIAQNIAPLKVGEVLFARAEGNGISGHVATTGKSYICPEIQDDPLYREGLDNAASSLTVPLKLDDRVIGTLNIESSTVNAFSDHQRLAAEQFGRYIAAALNLLDLLVVERFTTNQQAATNIIGELSLPLAELAKQAAALRDRAVSENDRNHALQLLKTIDRVNDRLQAFSSGPRTILGAEQELHRHELDPLLVGKRILVADDEPAIRDTLNTILTQKGAVVTVCDNGGSTIAAIEKAIQSPGTFYDLVISDIKMPDRNGYEVYRTVKSLKPDTPVILMTGFGYDPHHCIVRASQEGLQSFLFKPFKVSQLMDVVQRSLARV